jgi:hypothetical protein
MCIKPLKRKKAKPVKSRTDNPVDYRDPEKLVNERKRLMIEFKSEMRAILERNLTPGTTRTTRRN